MNRLKFHIVAIVLTVFIVGCGPQLPGNDIIPWFVNVPGGSFLFGDNEGTEYEGPEIEMIVDSFQMTDYEVTNAQFRYFVEETGYVTDAEKSGEGIVFDGEWKVVKGADWKHPFGPNSSIDSLLDHPVVMVSYYDAKAFCEWWGGRLPTEVEWEYACKRGGLVDEMNIWTGNFPSNNNGKDGYIYTSPVALEFPYDSLGLHHMQGNVWEWCEDVYNAEVHDKWSSFPADSNYVYLGATFDPTKEVGDDTLRVIKGGSFMCHETYCSGFLPYARQSAAQHQAFFHIGFRVVRDIQ